MTTTQEWLEKAKQHKDVLEQLIGAHHPRANFQRPSKPSSITAPMAEAAADVVRNSIRSKGGKDPVEEFKQALETGDVRTINLLLNDTWFGVPESTSCWSIPGFSQAVDLIEDPPEVEEPGL